MTLIELKDCITNRQVPTEFMIFVEKDNTFLSRQYLKAIEQLCVDGMTKVSSIYEPQQSSISLLTSTEETINVMYTEVFDERAENYSQFINTIVVCSQIDKSIADEVKNYTIKFPKLEDWQICDYAKTLCPSLDDADIQWLIKATNADMNRIINELNKAALFRGDEQKAVFSTIRFDTESDLYKIDGFAVVNALVDGNMPVLFDFLSHSNTEDLEPVVLANRAFSSLKNILLVSQNPSLTNEDCGISAGQFRFIKYNYRTLNVQAAKNKIKFLTGFDLALKTSKLDMSKRDMLNYLISNLSYKIV